jgi:sec-independent protein translocase protein TatA
VAADPGDPASTDTNLSVDFAHAEIGLVSQYAAQVPVVCRFSFPWEVHTYLLGFHGEIPMLNNIGLPGLLLIAVVVLVLFGRGKISSLMGEVGKGITAFKKGVDEGKKEIEEEASAVAKDVTPEQEKDKA